MRLYQIDYKKLVALLLPTMLRKPLILVLLQCATRGIGRKHSEFLSTRDDNLYRIGHTGQVCYLRTVLNDAFPERSCDFAIEDSSATSEWVYAMDEEVHPNNQLQITAAEPFVYLWSEDYVLLETTPFLVKCPPEVFTDSDGMDRVRHLVNNYKLLSKRAMYAAI